LKKIQYIVDDRASFVKDENIVNINDIKIDNITFETLNFHKRKLMKILAFDIWGDFAHFRKYYTTSSPLTFSFPPPPTISGILGAIYGCDKFTNEYLKLFGTDSCKISLKILSTIKKTRIGLNLINTKDGFWVPIKKKNHEPRTQIPVEFVKNPKYRIFFHIRG